MFLIFIQGNHFAYSEILIVSGMLVKGQTIFTQIKTVNSFNSSFKSAIYGRCLYQAINSHGLVLQTKKVDWIELSSTLNGLWEKTGIYPVNVENPRIIRLSFLDKSSSTGGLFLIKPSISG